jgi:hypothetical protein
VRGNGAQKAARMRGPRSMLGGRRASIVAREKIDGQDSKGVNIIHERIKGTIWVDHTLSFTCRLSRSDGVGYALGGPTRYMEAGMRADVVHLNRGRMRGRRGGVRDGCASDIRLWERRREETTAVPISRPG